MSKRDYYEVLGLERSASGSQIKQAYRKLAMKHHPDKNLDNKQAEEAFKEINEAYDVLKEQNKRAAYDQYGHKAFENGGPSGGFDGNFSSVFENINDIFEGFMGGGGRQRRARGRDVQVQIRITLEQAFHGHDVTISYPRAEPCDNCRGSGRAEYSSIKRCGNCHGTGRLRMQQAIFTVEQTCPACGGEGEIITDPCRKCRGSGALRGQKEIKIHIPPGIDRGARIRIPDQGEAGPHGLSPGDLYALIDVQPHRIFERDSENLNYVLPIGMVEAALGHEVEIPTPGGEKMMLKIPPGTQPGTKMRIRGRGMPVINSGGRRGNLFVRIAVEVPVNLSSEQREVLEQLRETLQGKHSPGQVNFFKRAKDFWQQISSNS